MLRLIAIISLVIGPLVLLVFFQLQFLPYHHEAISWWQRLTVVADLALLWTLWPSVARGETTSIQWSDFRQRGVIAAAVASLLPVLLVFTVATFPGELLHAIPPSEPFIPEWVENPDSKTIRWLTPHQYLVAGDVNLITGRTNSLWSNRLVLPNLEQPVAGFSARGRHLEGAVLVSANLQKVDFTAANLRAAVLNDADLSGAKFLCATEKLKARVDEREDADGPKQCARLDHASLAGARLQNAVLDGALAERAEFPSANLQNASLRRTVLKGAKLYGAHLEGAVLSAVYAQGAFLTGAQLQGARLDQAQMQGASFDRAQLQAVYADIGYFEGATFARAQLQGASFEQSKLDAANFDGAELQGASFASASLIGASFRTPASRLLSIHAPYMQGARFTDATLEGAVLERVEVWRVELSGDGLSGARIVDPGSSAIPDYEALKQMIEKQTPDGELKTKALQRIARLDPDAKFDDAESAKAWTDAAQIPVPIETFYRKRAERIQMAGCDPANGPFVIEAVFNSFNSGTPPQNAAMAPVAAAFLDPSKCKAAAGLAEQTKADLRMRMPSASP